MQINIISCQTEEDYKEIIKLLKLKYKNNPCCKFREISDTFVLPDKKWIIVNKNLVKMLMRNKPNNKLYNSDIIKKALEKEKQSERF